MTSGEIYDLLVVGAGPAGARVAGEVARAGCNVVILEQKTSLDDPICCTGLISEECLKSFDINPKVILGSFSSATVFSPAGKAISVRRDTPQAHALDRPAFDRWLYGIALTQGARVIMGARVTSLARDPGGLTVRFECCGQAEEIRARTAVLAAGFGSKLLGDTGLERGNDWTMGVQTEVETDGGRGIEIYLGRNYAPGYFAWMVPTAFGRAHVGLMARRRTKAHLGALLERLRKDGKIKNAAHPVFRGITLAPPAKTFSERVLVVGDLAGHVKPITGGGIYFGLLCADIAARHIIASLGCNDYSARTLVAYEREWRSLLDGELRAGRRARQVYGFIGDRQLEFMIGLAKRLALVERLAGEGDIGFDWHGAAIRRACRFISPFKKKESR